jgi:hypothetical protein
MTAPLLCPKCKSAGELRLIHAALRRLHAVRGTIVDTEKMLDLSALDELVSVLERRLLSLNRKRKKLAARRSPL